METESEFDMKHYLSLTGGSSEDTNTVNLNLLKSLVYNHVSNINYQNYDLLTGKEILDMTPNGLLQRLLVDRRGGMCYETSELMFYVLFKLGFDVRRVAVSVLNDTNYDPTEPLVHNILIVHLDGKMYLVDIGFGYNSIRWPVEFDFEKTEEKFVIPGEKYQLICEEDYYQLNLFIKDRYASLYRFPRPITYIDHKQSMAYYHDLVTLPQTLYIRDSGIYFGVIVEGGRFCFSCDYTDGSASNFTFMSIQDGVTDKQKLEIDGFVDLVKKHSKFSIKNENIEGKIIFKKAY
ncbi:Hypothetical protein NTJ_09839 [Nesidiocoris tenuis]|nr:Hypothetical protein NTJ_09839 [Nesidiocoris tenuis]